MKKENQVTFSEQLLVLTSNILIIQKQRVFYSNESGFVSLYLEDNLPMLEKNLVKKIGSEIVIFNFDFQIYTFLIKINITEVETVSKYSNKI